MKNPVVLFGLSGSGKSFVAEILEKEFNYVWIRSDEIRKRLAGIDPSKSAKADFGKGIYTPQMTEKVYRTMVEMARKLVEENKKVVLDATFLKRWQRDLVRSLFPEALFILVTAEEGEIERRLKERVDISDADFEIYKKQKETFEHPQDEEFLLLDTTARGREEIIEVLKDLLEN